MNTIISFTRKLIANLIWVALIVVIIVSWKAYRSYKENSKNICELQTMVDDAHKNYENSMDKIKLQKEEKEALKDKIYTTNARMKFGNITQSCCDLASYSVQYIQSDIKSYSYYKEFLDALIASYTKEKELTIAQGKMYLNFWEEELRNNWPRYLIAALLTVFFTPFLIACIMYYGIAWFVENRKPDTASAAPQSSGIARLDQADARIKYNLQSGRHLYLRAGWCKGRKNVVTKTKLLWRWKYPLVSIVADLCELVDFSAANHDQCEIMITAPIEDLFIGKVDLNNSELVIRPRYLVGVTDDVSIRTHWDFSLHSIFSGRIRKVILCGTGTVFIGGSWGVEGQTPKAGEDYRIESGMLLGYESGAQYSLCRTETFWHYFREKTDLFDIKIRKGVFLTQNNAWSAMKASRNNVDAMLKFFFDGIFSILGL